MRALVLCGAANYGPLQVGALEAILAAGYHPELIVGTSAGAINGLFLSQQPTLVRARRLAALWREADHLDLKLPGEGELLLRQLRGCEGLVSHHALLRMFEAHFGRADHTFGDLLRQGAIPAYTVAFALDPPGLRVFGDRAEDRVVDGLMASTALPPVLAPWSVDGIRYIDGGVVANLPIRIAVERGGDVIVAVHIVDSRAAFGQWRGMMRTAGLSLAALLENQASREIEWAREAGVSLRLIQLPMPSDVPFWDFRRSFHMARLGRLWAEQVLRQEGLPAAPQGRSSHRSRLPAFATARPSTVP